MSMTEDTVSDISTWFEEADLGRDIIQKDRNVQIGVHFEEVSEMLSTVEMNDVQGTALLGVAKLALHNLADHCKSSGKDIQIALGKEVEFLDALCDQIVTAIGVACRHNMDIVGALAEVSDSNWSKFDESGKPIRNEDGKIIKGPNYRPPELDSFISSEA